MKDWQCRINVSIAARKAKQESSTAKRLLVRVHGLPRQHTDVARKWTYSVGLTRSRGVTLVLAPAPEAPSLLRALLLISIR